MGSPFVRVLASSLLLPLLAVTSTAQRGSQQIVKGRYTGSAWNTTSGTGSRGDAVLVIGESELPAATFSVAMSFSNGLCGEGVSTGSQEQGVLKLFGYLSSNGDSCGEQSWNMVTRCTMSQSGDLQCEYWLYARPGFQADDQKGYFEVSSAGSRALANPTGRPRPAESDAQSDPPAWSYFSDEADPGVDFASVVAPGANLRRGPDGASSALMEVRQGENLVLLNRTPTGPWYNVIHVESSSDGWVHGSVIRLVYTRTVRPAPQFRAEQVDTYSEPRIELDNTSHKNLSLRVGETIYSIPAYSKRSVTFAAGVYKYYAAAPGVLPAIGERTFRVGHIYTWTFSIRTRP